MSTMERFVHAMLSGMVILVLPSLVVCSVIAVVAWRRRDGESGD
jgi:hypothetical protein